MDAAQIQQALADLALNVANLTNQVQLMAANPPNVNVAAPVIRPQSYVQKPATYDGKTASDARRFLAAYKAWAKDQGEGLQRLNALGQMADDYPRWILTACSFLTGEAADWATGVVEGMAGTTPPYNSYDEFVKAFRTRFETVNEKQDALAALNRLWMGTGTAADYTAQFKQHVGRLNLSEEDKRLRYRSHLSDYVKDELSKTNLPHGTYEEMLVAVQSIDARCLERKAEKEMEQGRRTFAPNSQPRSQSAPFQQSLDDAMDISASQPSNGKTREDWRKAMRGKCYGCGSSDHSVTACSQRRVICQWCKKVGHTSAVCMTRYLGRPKNSGNAQSVRASTSDANNDSGPAQPAPAAVNNDVIAALTRQMGALNAVLTNITGDFGSGC